MGRPSHTWTNWETLYAPSSAWPCHENVSEVKLRGRSVRRFRSFALKPLRASGTRGSSLRGSAIIGTLARISPAIEGLRQPLPLRPKGTDKSSLDALSRFPWRSRMRRTTVDTRCMKWFRRVAARSYASPNSTRHESLDAPSGRDVTEREGK